MLVAEILATLWPSYSHADGNVLPPNPLRLEVSLPDAPDAMDSVEAHWAAGTLDRGLPRLDMPALLIHGVADPLPSNASVKTAALIPGARLELVERGVHFPWLERRDDIGPIVKAFLAEH